MVDVFQSHCFVRLVYLESVGYSEPTHNDSLPFVCSFKETNKPHLTRVVCEWLKKNYEEREVFFILRDCLFTFLAVLSCI